MRSDSPKSTRKAPTAKKPAVVIPHDWVLRYEVQIDDSQKALKVEHQRLVDIARSVLAAEQVVSANISLAIVDNDLIHELNVRYLEHDFPTDVLSFLLEEEIEPDSLPIPKGSPRGYGKRLEGEVILSAEMAKQEAAKYHWKPMDELSLYLVHGLLHLCGHDDKTVRLRTAMQRREQEVLAAWGLSPHAAEPE